MVFIFANIKVINTYTDINKAYLKLKLGFLFYGTQTQL